MSDPGPSVGEAAYQGRPGAFSEVAARAFVGETAALVPCPTFGAVVDALDRGLARHAVLPVVNAIAGGVGEALDLVAARADLVVVGATTVPVAMALVAPPGVPFDAIRRVRSHPVALAQCRRFFEAHPALAPVVDVDTAGAVEAVVAEDRGDEAALASVRAAHLHGAAVLRRGVQDHPANATRFLCLVRADAADRLRFTQDLDTAPLRLAVWTGPDAGLLHLLARCEADGWRLRHIERRPHPAGSGHGRFVLELARMPPGETAAAGGSMDPAFDLRGAYHETEMAEPISTRL